MKKNIAKKIWITVILIIAIGLVALFSASYQNVRVSQNVFYDQLFIALTGLVLMFLISKFDYRRFYDAAYVLYGLNVLLLIFVLVGGHDALGARRWIDLFGINFQPSELTKLTIILALARYFSNRRIELSFSFATKVQKIFRQILFPLLMTLLPMVLIFKQPDLGTSLLMFGIFLALLFTSEIEYRYFFGLIGICTAVVPFMWQHLKDYQKDRLLVFFNPNIDPLGAGYTIIQSKIAVGSGQIFGKGWLAGTQNTLNFLPERHTDFIFSVIGEEWGLVGSVFLIFCFFMLIMYSLQIAEQIKDDFGVHVCIGITTILTLQVIINIGMVLGVFPIVGLTLPFISYGRSSFIIFIFMMGFLLNLSNRRTIF